MQKEKPGTWQYRMNRRQRRARNTCLLPATSLISLRSAPALGIDSEKYALGKDVRKEN